MNETDFVTLHEEFLQLESDLDLLDERIRGVYFWERLRFRIHKRLSTVLGISEGGTEGAEGLSEYLAGGGLLLRNLAVRNPYFADPAELLFYGKGRRKRLDDGRWWDIYVDPILEKLSRDHLCLERPYDVGHLRPAKTERLRYTDLIQYSGTVLEKLGIATPSLSVEERQLLERTASELESRFGVSVPLRRMVREDLAHRRVRLPLYGRLLDRIEPEIAFLTAAYNGRETFVEACQSRGIPVVELQHGVVTKYHMGYSFPDRDKNVFPDYFFSFGEYWSDSVELPLPEENVYPVGFPHLENRRREYEDVDPGDRIVVISQVRVGERLSEFALALSRSETFDHEVVYKLHPKEYDGWEQRYPHLVDSDVTVVRDDPPLYELLAESTAQVGVNSTALFEGLQFGVATYVLDLPGVEYVADLIEAGHVTSVGSADEFLSCWEDWDGAGPRLETEHLFEPDPIEAFERAIEDISG